MFVVDQTIRNINLVTTEKKMQCYKVVNPKATVKSMNNTVNYLLKKRYKYAEKVVVHLGKNDIKYKLTEEIKHDFKIFANTLSKDNKKLIISGPVPSCDTSCEYFSRLLCLNEWLKNWTNDECIPFIDNFDLFWKKGHLFYSYGRHLNEFGQMVLSNNIKTSIGTSLL